MAKIDIELANGARAGQTLKELTKEARTLNKEIQNLKPGTDEFVKKSGELQKVNARLGEVRGQIKGTTEASNELKGVFTQFIPFSGTFQKVGESLGFVTKGVGGLSRGFGVLRGAIISTGIGALVVALGSLIAYLTSTQEGMDKVTAVLRPLQAIFQRLIGVVQDLGGKAFKRLQEAIENPKQAFIDLGNVIKENIINRFEALALFGPAIAKLFSGDISGGFKDLGNAAIQLTTGVENAIDKLQEAGQVMSDWVKESIEIGKQLDALQKQIERAEINQIKRTKELELVIKQQKAVVEDETRSYDARREAAENALKAQEQLLNGELSLLDKRIAKMKIEQSQNDTSREQEKELAELEAKRLEIRARVTEQGIEFNKKINELNKKQAAEEAAVIRNLEDLRVEARQQGLEKELAAIDAETERKIEALTGSAEQIAEQEALLEEIRAQKIKELRDQYAQEQSQKELQDRINSLEYQLAVEVNALNEQLLARQISEDEYRLIASQRAVEYQRERLDLIRASHGEESLEYQRAYKEFLDLQKASLDVSDANFKKSITANREALLGSVGVFGSFFGALASFQQQGTEQWKAFSIASAVMSTIQGAINAYSSTAAIPIVGPVLAPIAAGLALAAGYKQVNEIRKQKPTPPAQSQKFTGVLKAERGMLLQGKRHSQGGIQVEAEDGEFILSRKTVRGLGARNLSYINDYFNRKFESGGPINPFSTSRGGSSPSGRDSDLSTSFLGMDSISNKIDQLIEAQDRRIDRMRVINVVTDTEEGIQTVNQIREDADV